MEEHHLQLNLAKTERVVFPATPTLHDFTIQLGSSTITPSSLVRNLGVIFNVQLTFKDHIAKTARSYRFALHNIRKIRCYCAWLASKLAWPEPYRESMEYCQEEDERHQTQQCRWPEGRYQQPGLHYTWAVPQADCLHAMPHWCTNSCKRRPNQVLSA